MNNSKGLKDGSKDVQVNDNRTAKRKVGDIGETIACQYILNKGFKILGRNYLKPYGEIDIIAEKAGIYHFIEVKTITLRIVTHVTKDEHRPEDNVHELKLKRLSNAI